MFLQVQPQILIQEKVDSRNAWGDNEYAAYGETKWQGVYHYTTAQMELSNGTVKTTSGRQYGYNQTSAQSPWYLPKSLFENTEARTYWGT